MAAPNPDLWARNRGKTLGQVVTRALTPAPVILPPPSPPPSRGGAEMGRGSYELPLLPKMLPYWWPDRVSR
jgi:hypothetical protein